MFIFVAGGLPSTFVPVPAATPGGESGGSITTVGTLAAVVPMVPGRTPRMSLTDRSDAWSCAGSNVVPDVSGGTFITFFHPGASLGPAGRTRRYNVDPVPSTSGASVKANRPGQPIAPSGPSVATQPWPRVTPVWPVRTRF